MKTSLIYSIYFLLVMAWLALGGFSLYFSEYASFKVMCFIFLACLSYVIFQHTSISKQGIQVILFKNKFLISIKVVLVVIIFCLLHFLNTNQYWSLDLTFQKLYKIRSASITLIKTLTKDKEIVINFWGTREHWNQNEDLLLSYKNASSNVKLNWIDPDKNPEQAITIQGRTLPIISLDYAGQRKWVEVIDEWMINNSLNSFREKKNKTLCFLSSHQTLDVLSQADEGLYDFKNYLQSEGYSIQKVELKDEEQMRACNLLFILGPKDDFLSSEIEQLVLVAKNIPLIVAITPSANTMYLANFRKWLNQVGIMTTGAPVIDQSVLQLGEQAINVLWENHHHPISEEWAQLQRVKGRVLFQLTTAFDLRENTKATLTPLMFSQTFPNTWQESNWDGVVSGKVSFDNALDKKGPLVLSVSLENSAISQMIVLGTDRLWINGLKNYPANFSLALSMINTLFHDAELLPENSVVLREEKLYLHQSQAKLVFYMSIVVMPVLMLLLAYSVFRRKSIN